MLNGIRSLSVWILSLRKLISYNQDFESFFNNPTDVGIVCFSRCEYDPNEQAVRLYERDADGYVLLRNESTYLLIETVLKEKRWRTAFAADEKGALADFEQQIQAWHPERSDAWPFLFPLIRKAHEEAHAPRRADEPNTNYLADLMSAGLHTFDVKSFVDSEMERFATEKSL